MRHSTSLLTVLHALVDGLCACCVFMTVPTMDYLAAMGLFVAYNALAFLTQPLVGLWMDRHLCRPVHLITGIGLLSAGAVFALLHHYTPYSVLPFVMVALIGMGNSVFHVYGGRVVALGTANDKRHLGIFVSSGALGLLFGSQSATLTGWLTIVLSLLVITFIYIKYEPRIAVAIEDGRIRGVPPMKGIGTASRWLFAFILLVVFIRSFVGKIEPFSTDVVPYYAMIGTVLAFVGKASGGFLAQKLGVWRTLTTALLLAASAFLLGYYHTAFLLLMVLCINLTMPLTLHLANSLYPRRGGFAFGMLAAILAPGVGLAMLCSGSDWSYDLLYPLFATILIEALVLLGLRERRWQVLSMSVVMNILTNLSLNALVLFVLPHYPSAPMIFVLEATVVVIEALLFYPATRSWKQAVAYSLICNVTSYVAGLLFVILPY